MKRTATLLLIATFVLISIKLRAQMVNPDMDKPGEPFSYPACSTDQIGLQNALEGTEITPGGYLYTGYGEMMFALGYPSKPAWQRIRTLQNGYLPIINYTYHDGSVRYNLTTFAAPLSSQHQARNPVDFVRVVARNTGAQMRTSYFNVAFRYTGGQRQRSPCNMFTHRFYRPVPLAKPGGYSQPGVKFNPHWVYGFTGDFATRSGMVVYQFSTAPKPVLWLTRTRRYRKPQQVRVSPGTQVLVAQYEIHLPPGGSQTLVFKMPVRPIATSNTAAIQQLKSLSFDTAFSQTEARWEKRLDQGIQISLPEKEVSNTFRASEIYDMMAREYVDNQYIQHVNLLQYHAFWLRDGSHFMNTYDETGYLNLVRQSLPLFMTFQKPDGLFISQRRQYDGWGQALWTFGRYYQFSHDRDFARRVFPSVLKAVRWLEQARAKDPLHIMPAGNPGDDEFHETAHVTGHNLWALAGLKEAIVLAKAVGTPAQVKEFQHEYNNYHQVLFRLLDKIGARDGEYIPPGIDVKGGQDWGNMNVLYPEILVSPDNPLVKGTLRHVRKEYAQGMITYGGYLHDYIGIRDTETELILEEQQQVIKDLYAELVHTEATHAGWEVGPLPWTTRDFHNDLAPHGWFATAYVSLLRNMMVREQGDNLHLLSTVSPDWTKPGDTIKVSNAPTEFGRMGMECRFSGDGMHLSLTTDFHQKPAHIIVHLPWFVTVKRATVDGKAVEVHQQSLSIPPSSREVNVAWTVNSPAPTLSYHSAVKAFQAELQAHYQKFLRNGSPARKPVKMY